ncbi:ABC transporter permease [Pyruvatibacter mobilis]|uniref:ABC transporter permease n=1 Tax=Pyruvatibacter mobilis TaxID=1712261 RepID=UPI003BAA4BCD
MSRSNGTGPDGWAARWGLPLLFGLVFLGAWEWLVAVTETPAYVLPGPLAIGTALVQGFGPLMASLWVTLRITLIAFVLALVLGTGFAVLFSESRLAERALYPYAVALQVTPIVAIAPLILIWVGLDNAEAAVTILAVIAAFFPVLANMTAGLKAADRNLIDLFRLYGASRWQIVTGVRLPSALPYLLSAMKVSAGLALIGTVVAEFVAGSGTSTGLAWRIIEAGNRLEIARMFAALVLLSGLGIALFWALSALEHLLLRHWHDGRDGALESSQTG